MGSNLAGAQWRLIGSHRREGVVLFLPALRSRGTLSVGEYGDLLPMIDWCKEVGFDLIQLLPINDSGLEKSPYSALSAFALNPLYLTLPAPKSSREKALYEEISLHKRGKYFDYEAVYRLKESYLRLHFRREREHFDRDAFIAEHPWVETYALFKALKVLKNYRSWRFWRESPSKHYSEFPERVSKEFSFQCYQQMLSFCQMGRVKREAERQGVLLKGDIPILLSKESADVWSHREAFHTHFSAGAPPDNYSSSGQYWGFPTYNWSGEKEFLKKWWRSRLLLAERLFDLYRIDHAVGLYRLWTIPQGEKALSGHFAPGKRSEWMEQGRELLAHFLASSKMLPIAEDLGVVPKEIKASIRRLGIPGTRVIRWERGRSGELIDPKKYPEISMTTLSTHDNETSLRWWESSPDEAKAVAAFFGWKYEKKLLREQLVELLKLSHSSNSRFHVNLLQEYFPLVSGFCWGGKRGDRINIPGKRGKLDWLYRYRPTVEEIAANKKFKETLSTLLQKGGMDGMD